MPNYQLFPLSHKLAQSHFRSHEKSKQSRGRQPEQHCKTEIDDETNQIGRGLTIEESTSSRRPSQRKLQQAACIPSAIHI
jgi:hypothetical protein